MISDIIEHTDTHVRVIFEKYYNGLTFRDAIVCDKASYCVEYIEQEKAKRFENWVNLFLNNDESVEIE